MYTCAPPKIPVRIPDVSWNILAGSGDYWFALLEDPGRVFQEYHQEYPTRIPGEEVLEDPPEPVRLLQVQVALPSPSG